MVEKKSGKKKKEAVIRIGGGQELVGEGDILKISRVEGKEGSRYKIKEVLLVLSGDKTKIGTPIVSGAEVTVKILEHGQGEKVEIRKFRAKSRYRRKTGHRQPISKLQVEKIKV